MENSISGAIQQHFGDLKDPRMERTKLHQLLDILVIAICAVVCAADNWEEVEAFGLAKQDWLQTFLELPNGIPSHDTFNRVFARLDPEQFQSCFLGWVRSVSEIFAGQGIAIDGKVPRGSQDGEEDRKAIDMVSAWATANRLVLGQVKVDDKSNEIAAIPQLLQALEIAGCIVTIDAIGCQTEIAELIVEKGADYVLALKDNQGHLAEDVRLLFDDLEKSGYRAYGFDYVKTVDKQHGRIEIRECWTISNQEVLRYLRGFDQWKNFQTVSRIRSQRWIGDEKSCEERYHIASIGGAKPILGAVRSHWGIENELHWTLDMAFDEDHCRVRKEHGAENFTVLRHVALNLLKQEKSCQRSIKGKRLLSGWKEDYLIKVLAGLSSLGN